MTNLRKALAIGVSAVTMFSMSMIAVPFQVDAAAMAGDLIKIDGYAPVYYLGADNKRYVFPNEATYFSWYGDFSGVKTLNQTEVESYPLAANVVVRPGTKLVKRPVPTDPKVYAVEPNGKLRHIPSEAVAVSLYGNNWSKRVVDIVDSFFVNYTIGATAVAEGVYPAGSLVKYGTNPAVYYINAAGEAQKIATEAAFLANRFKWDDILTAPATATMPAAGTEIAAKGTMADTSQGGNSGTGPVVDPNVGTGLSVALSDETAGSMTVPSLSTLVPFITVNMTAANDGDVTIENLTFKRVGTGLVADIDGGYLYVGSERISTKKTVNSTDHTMTFSGLNYKIPAGTTKAITLKINAGSGNGNHAFQLTSAAMVDTNGAAVSGSFPITGNTMSLSSVEVGTVTFDGDSTGHNYKIGETKVALTEFTIANNNKEDVKVSRIRLKNAGTAADNSVSNLYLDIDGTKVMENVSMKDGYVDFVLDTAYLLKKSKTVTATVYGDVVADPGKNIILYVRNVADVEARGTAYGDFYSANIVTTAYDATADTGTMEIKGSDINVSFDGPAASDVRADRDDVVFANFKVNVAGNDGVQIDTLPVHLIMTIASSADSVTNLEMVDVTNNVSYTVADQVSADLDKTFNFEDVTLAAGKSYNFQIRGDIPEGTNVGQTYKVTMAFSQAVLGSGDTYISSDEAVDSDTAYSQSSLTGKIMTVANASVKILNVSTAAATYVKDAKGVLLYKGKIEASGVDDLKVSKLKVEKSAGTLATFGAAFDRVYLYSVAANGTETKLDDESSLSGTAVTFSGFTLNVPKGSSNAVYVVVRGDVKNAATAGTISLAWGTAAADSTVKDTDNNSIDVTVLPSVVLNTAGHTSTIATMGTYSMVIDNTEAGTNADKNVLAGGVRLLGRIKVTAQKEDVIIEDLVLQSATTSNITNSDIATLYLYEDKEMTKKLGSADFANGTDPKAMFEDVNITVPTVGTKYLYIGGLVKGIDYSASPSSDSTATAGRIIDLIIPANQGTYITKVKGASTGEVLDHTYDATLSKRSTIMGAVISAVTTSFANGTLSAGTAKDLFSFKVTVPASSNVDYDGAALGIQLGTSTFTVASSGVSSVGSFKIERVGGANGEVNASAVVSGSSLTIAIRDSYGSLNDRIVKPGETAEYVIKATIGSVAANASMQTTLEGMATNLPYTHNVGAAGVLTGATSEVFPLISGLSNVRGGTLSN